MREGDEDRGVTVFESVTAGGHEESEIEKEKEREREEKELKLLSQVGAASPTAPSHKLIAAFLLFYDFMTWRFCTFLTFFLVLKHWFPTERHFTLAPATC